MKAKTLAVLMAVYIMICGVYFASHDSAGIPIALLLAGSIGTLFLQVPEEIISISTELLCWWIACAVIAVCVFITWVFRMIPVVLHWMLDFSVYKNEARRRAS